MVFEAILAKFGLGMRKPSVKSKPNPISRDQMNMSSTSTRVSSSASDLYISGGESGDPEVEYGHRPPPPVLSTPAPMCYDNGTVNRNNLENSGIPRRGYMSCRRNHSEPMDLPASTSAVVERSPPPRYYHRQHLVIPPEERTDMGSRGVFDSRGFQVRMVPFQRTTSFDKVEDAMKTQSDESCWQRSPASPVRRRRSNPIPIPSSYQMNSDEVAFRRQLFKQLEENSNNAPFCFLDENSMDTATTAPTSNIDDEEEHYDDDLSAPFRMEL